MSEVTKILNQLADGSIDSADELLPAIYLELRQMAAAKMANEQVNNSIAATGLVHEAYLKLVGSQNFESRRHFFGAAAQAMRRILIDHARARNAEKRGGKAVRIEWSPGIETQQESDFKLESLDEALHRFEVLEPEKAELVKLRYFAGMKIREAAEVLGISTATADRHWAYAKAWLQTEIESD